MTRIFYNSELPGELKNDLNKKLESRTIIRWEQRLRTINKHMSVK